jgi:protein SCO1/2
VNLVIAGSALLVLALGAWFVIALLRAAPPPPFDPGPAATVLRVPKALPAFALSDHGGRPFDRTRLQGHWSFLFFGYTFCPDVCPNTLSVLREVHERLGGRDLAGVQFVFVSVDPERDSLERLARFVPYFHPDFIGVAGDEGALEPLVKALGIHYARRQGEAQEGYLVDHTVAVMLIDPEARLQAVFSTPHEPDAVADAFRKIRQRGERE